MHHNDASASRSAFTSNRRDKQQIKHSLLLSRLRASSVTDKRASSRISKNTRKRRRPSKKLVTDLASLADALPMQDLLDANRPDPKPASNNSTILPRKSQINISTRKSLRSRPGLRARKIKIEAMERERYRLNLAATQISNNVHLSPVISFKKGVEEDTLAAEDKPVHTDEENRASRWEVLRQHIISNPR